jgi:hypothetical protein
MLRELLRSGALLIGLAGCAMVAAPGGGPSPAGSPELFAHQVASSEVLLRWNCRQPEPNFLRVEGIAQNPWQVQPVGRLEFELVGVDAQGRTTTQAAGAAKNTQLRTNDSTPFWLELKTAGGEEQFDLYYRYEFQDNFDTTRLMVAGPPMAPPRLLAQTKGFVIRDACGATRHLAR